MAVLQEPIADRVARTSSSVARIDINRFRSDHISPMLRSPNGLRRQHADSCRGERLVRSDRQCGEFLLGCGPNFRGKNPR